MFAIDFVATADRVQVTQDASLNDLATRTVLAWVLFDGLAVNQGIYSKKSGSAFILPATGDITRLRVAIDRATTDTLYITVAGQLVAGQWRCCAFTWDINVTPTTNIYVGSFTQGLAEPAYDTATDGAGALVTDAASDFRWGNNTSDSVAMNGRIARAMHWNRVLSLAELQMHQFRPMLSPGLLIWHELGEEGIGRQVDYSGYQHHGVVTGPTNVVLGLPPAFMSPAWRIAETQRRRHMAVAAGHPATRRMGGVPFTRPMPRGVW